MYISVKQKTPFFLIWEIWKHFQIPVSAKKNMYESQQPLLQVLKASLIVFYFGAL